MAAIKIISFCAVIIENWLITIYLLDFVKFADSRLPQFCDCGQKSRLSEKGYIVCRTFTSWHRCYSRWTEGIRMWWSWWPIFATIIKVNLLILVLWVKYSWITGILICFSRSRTMDVSVGVPIHPAKEKPPINVVGDVGGRIAIMVVSKCANSPVHTILA